MAGTLRSSKSKVLCYSHEASASPIAVAWMDASSAGRAMQHKSHITLSFVVPAFNMEVYLGRCVDSLLMAKDSSDIEIIVIDDGSSEGTAAIADG